MSNLLVTNFILKGESGPRGPPGEIDLDRLRPILVEIIREMIPGGIYCLLYFRKISNKFRKVL